MMAHKVKRGGTRVASRIQEIRRARLQELVDKYGGATSLSKRLGYADASYIGQMLTGRRPISEKTARGIEEKLSLTSRSLDTELGAEVPFAGLDLELFS